MAEDKVAEEGEEVEAEAEVEDGAQIQVKEAGQGKRKMTLHGREHSRRNTNLATGRGDTTRR